MSTVLVGQASCLSVSEMTGNPTVAGLSQHFCPKYVTQFMKKST